MPIAFYKPNKKITGCLCGVSFDSRVDGHQAVFFELVKQTGWDKKRDNGTFKDGDKLILKFGLHEVARLISAMDRKEDVKFYHDSPAAKSSITFQPVKNKEDGSLRGFGLSVYRTAKDGDKSKFSIMFAVNKSSDEALQLREYLKFSMNHIFNGIHYKDVALKKKAAAQRESVSQEQKKTNKADTKAEPDW